MATERLRWRVLRELYGRWQARDAQRRPWAHTWRTRLPVLTEALTGCTITGLRAVEGAWDMCGSHGLEVELHTADGHELHLHVGADDALGGAEAQGPTDNWDDDWLEAQSALGVAVSLTLYDERMDPACREGPPPQGWGEDGDLEVIVPSVEPWWDQETYDRASAAAQARGPHPWWLTDGPGDDDR